MIYLIFREIHVTMIAADMECEVLGGGDLKEGSALCCLMMLMSGLFSLFESESKINNRQIGRAHV